MTDTTNQSEVFDVFAHRDEAGVDTAQLTAGVDDQSADEGGSPSDEGDPNPPETVEEEYEEIERGDKRYKIPKALKDDLLRQDDYTRKTQLHAEDVRKFEARAAAFEASTEAALKAAVEVKIISDRLADLNALTESDWNQLRAMDAQDGGDRYLKLMREMSALPHKLAEAEGTSKAERDRITQEQSAAQTKLFEQGQAVLARDIPGWGPDLGAKLVSFVKEEFGIDEQRHGAAFMDPALVKMAHAAFRAKEAARKAATTQKATEATKNAPPATARSAAPQTGLHDNLPAAEWARRRNEQLAKRR